MRFGPYSACPLPVMVFQGGGVTGSPRLLRPPPSSASVGIAPLCSAFGTWILLNKMFQDLKMKSLKTLGSGNC